MVAGGAAHGQDSQVPSEFRFLYEGSIRGGQLKAVWAALPCESITLERPAYKVTFHRGAPLGRWEEKYEDRLGRAELQAHVSSRSVDSYTKSFPEKNGAFVGRIDIWSYGRLCRLIEATQFHRLPDQYVAPWTDDSIVIVTTVTDRRSKRVLEHGGVGPIELWGVQEAIDSIAKGIKWTPK